VTFSAVHFVSEELYLVGFNMIRVLIMPPHKFNSRQWDSGVISAVNEHQGE